MSAKARGKEISAELEALEPLARALKRVKPPPHFSDAMQSYRDRLDAQIFLDRRIVRAADPEVADDQAIAVGLDQNSINRTKRTNLAKQIGLSRCLYDAGAQ